MPKGQATIEAPLVQNLATVAHLRAQLLELRPNIRRHDQIVPRRAGLDLAGEPVGAGFGVVSAGGADGSFVRSSLPVRTRLIARQPRRLRDLAGGEAITGRDSAQGLIPQLGSCRSERVPPACFALAIVERGQSDRQERGGLGDRRGQPQPLALGTGEPRRFTPQLLQLVQEGGRMRILEQPVEA